MQLLQKMTSNMIAHSGKRDLPDFLPEERWSGSNIFVECNCELSFMRKNEKGYRVKESE